MQRTRTFFTPTASNTSADTSPEASGLGHADVLSPRRTPQGLSRSHLCMPNSTRDCHSEPLGFPKGATSNGAWGKLAKTSIHQAKVPKRPRPTCCAKLSATGRAAQFLMSYPLPSSASPGRCHPGFANNVSSKSCAPSRKGRNSQA